LTQRNKRWYQKKESWMIGVGGGVAFCAISIPFLIMFVTKKKYTLDSFQTMGVIGDFFGGTTVGLLSLSSIIFVTAAIIMQKEELELQRIEVKKTREEYEITNQTMRMQQFETTFFNMINLHHNILKDIQKKDKEGRDVINQLYKELKFAYNNNVYANYSEKLKNDALNGNSELLDDLVEKELLNHYLNKYKEEFETHYMPGFNGMDDPDTSDYDKFYESLSSGTDPEWNRRKEQYIIYFKNEVYKNKLEYRKWLDDLNFKNSSKEFSNYYIDVFKENFLNNPLNELKIEAYEIIYKQNENLIGHYYRNLYRIFKLIQNENFHVEVKKNEELKSKYRGILRAQLSSVELLMIFYNVVYSKKGKKFKDLLQDTNFFDDHLVNSDFIWTNDKQELIKLGTKNN
jgi:hypothetical protein